MSGTEAEELLEATRMFLRETLLPELSGFQAYSTRVAANNLAILARELEHAGELRALDAQIARDLGLDATAGDIPTQVARRLRSGEQAADARLWRYLKQRALVAMAIDNPRYASLALAQSRWRETGSEEGQL